MRFEQETEDLVARIMSSDKLKGILEKTKAFGDKAVESGAAKGIGDFTLGCYIGWTTDLIQRGIFPNKTLIHTKPFNLLETSFYLTGLGIYEDCKDDTLSNPRSNPREFAKSTTLRCAGILAGQFASECLMQYTGGSQ